MKKLLMMDSRTFNRLTTPKDKVLTSIEGEMSSILNDDSIPEDVKAKLYASKQSRFMKIEHPQWGETTTVTNTKTLNSPDVVLDTLPNSLVRKGKRISEILKSTNRVSVNDKNEFVIDGDVIQGSNANDVYLDILKKRKNTSIGHEEVTQILHETGVPSDILPNPNIKQARTRESSVPPLYVTPGRPNTRRRNKVKYDTLFK
jgi:hypothetical protein